MRLKGWMEEHETKQRNDEREEQRNTEKKRT